MEILVLGTGCQNCRNLYEMTKKALEELNIEADLKKVEDIAEIMKYSMTTPALVVDGNVVHAGKPLPDLEKIKKIISK
ncbi:MAG: thioredoxin family protein [Calditerrivibrio sp.]|nr:thioredoxin family protein [Calditerrivibrio sp.]